MINRFKIAKRALPIALLSLILSTIGMPVAHAAIDQTFYATNDILFYDPDACEVKSGSAVNGNIVTSGNDVAEKIFRFLTGTSFASFDNKPFNAIQAAGALGNFQQESGMDPSAVEGNGEGHGLAQWSFGRKQVLFDLAKEMKKSWSDLEVQIQMMKNELDGGYGKSLLTRKIDGKLFTEVTSPKDASYIFQKIYEAAGIPAQAKRDSAAAAYYEKFKGIAPSTPDGAAVADGGSCTPTGSTSDFATDGFVIYNQFDPRWASLPYGSTTIAAAGCGPSSMAMIITALTGQSVTPKETTAYADEKGMYTAAGSSWAIARVVAEHWGLKAKNIPNTVSAVNDVLKAGGLVVTSGSGATPFTSGGHYITIRGVTDSGKWKIGDSNGNKGRENSNKEWDPQYILDIANAGNVVAITK